MDLDGEEFASEYATLNLDQVDVGALVHPRYMIQFNIERCKSCVTDFVLEVLLGILKTGNCVVLLNQFVIGVLLPRYLDEVLVRIWTSEDAIEIEANSGNEIYRAKGVLIGVFAV